MKTPIYFKRYIKNDFSQKREFCFYPNGTRFWALNEEFHREDGPAYEGFKGHKEWWINGHRLSEEGYLNLMTK